MKKLAACVGVWRHSAVNNDKLKDIQRQLEEDFHKIYELIRRNDTRCDCILNFLFGALQIFSYLFGLNSSLERVFLQINLFLLDMTCALYQFRLFFVFGIEILHTAPCSFSFFLV